MPSSWRFARVWFHSSPEPAAWTSCQRARTRFGCAPACRPSSASTGAPPALRSRARSGASSVQRAVLPRPPRPRTTSRRSPAPVAQRFRPLLPPAYEAEAQPLHALDAFHPFATAFAVQPLEDPPPLFPEIDRRLATEWRERCGHVLATVVEGELRPAEGIDVCEPAPFLMWLAGDPARPAQGLPCLFARGEGGIEGGRGPRRLPVAYRTEIGNDLGEAGTVEGGGGRGLGFPPGRARCRLSGPRALHDRRSPPWRRGRPRDRRVAAAARLRAAGEPVRRPVLRPRVRLHPRRAVRRAGRGR